jgi:hypothetical protein
VLSLAKIIRTMENRNIVPFHLAIITNFATAHLLWQQLIKMTKKKKIPEFMLLCVKILNLACGQCKFH